MEGNYIEKYIVEKIQRLEAENTQLKERVEILRESRNEAQRGLELIKGMARWELTYDRSRYYITLEDAYHESEVRQLAEILGLDIPEAPKEATDD